MPIESDDVSQAYAQHAQETNSNAVVQGLLQRVQARQAPPAPSPAPAPQTPASGQASPGAAPSQAQPGATLFLMYDSDGHPFYSPDAPGPAQEGNGADRAGGSAPQTLPGGPQPLPPGPSFMDAIKAAVGQAPRVAGNVAADVGEGVVEAPGAAVSGVYDASFNAVHNAADASDELTTWLDQNVAHLGGDDTHTDNANFAGKFMQNPIRAIADIMPGKPPETAQSSVTGHLIRETTRFLTGFIPASRAFGGGKAGAVLGGGAEGVVGDHEQSNMAELVKNFPVLGKILSPLQKNPDDPVALKMAKNGLDGIVGSTLGEGLLLATRFLIKARRAIPALNAQKQTAEAQKQLYGSASGRDYILANTDPNQPMVLAGKSIATGAADPLDKLAQATKATETGVPDAVVAKGVAQSAEDHASQAGLTRVLGGNDAPASHGVNPGYSPIPNSASELGERSVPVKNSETAAPPGVQPLDPASQVSTRIPPSGTSTTRPTRPPSKRVGVNTNFSDFPFDIKGTSEKNIFQQSDDYKALLTEAQNKLSEFSSEIQGVADGVNGAKFAGARVKEMKGPNGLESKMKNRGLKGSEISDYLGGRISVDSEQSASEVIQKIADKYRVLEVDNKIANPKAGYRAVHVQVDLGNGMSAEVQVVPSEISAIQGVEHKGYDKFKNITENGTEEEKAAAYAAKAQGEKNYNAAWKKQQKTWGALPENAGQEVYVNFGRINTPDDVQQVIRDMADAFAPDIKKAQRGVQSNEETAKLATELGMTPEDLLSRQKGQPFNAEQSLAARRLLNTSAAKVLELAQKASDINGTLADQFNFRRMMAIHQAIQSEVLAARTETARALQSWSIPAGGDVEAARNIQMLMDSMGGAPVTQELAKRIALLSGQHAPNGAISAAIRKGWAATTHDAAKEAFVMGLLWNPATHAANITSNLAVAFQQIYERSAASKISDFLGTAADDRVVDGEAIAMAYATIMSIKDAFRLAARAARTGEQSGIAGSKVDLREPAISSAAIAREKAMTAPERAAFAQSGAGRAIDFIGEVNRVPGRLLGTEDEFFKIIGYRAELHAQAVRQATQEGKTGPDVFTRMMEIVNDPPEQIRIAAADAALYTTFQNKAGWVAQNLMNIRNAGGSLNPIFTVLPFLKTPANILSYNFARSPIAPLTRQWRDDIAAGGARRDLALARMATGTAILAAVTDYASSGVITGAGPKDPGKREALQRQGWQPFSIKYGDKYAAYNRSTPIGVVMGASATLAEMLKSKELSPEDFDTVMEITGHLIGVMSQAVVSQTWLQGVQRGLDTISRSESTPQAVSDYFNQQAGSMVPGSSLLSTVKNAVDPTQRDYFSAVQAIEARIVGLSDKLPPSRDLWGEEKSPDAVYGRAFDIVSPVRVSKFKPNPIDTEMVRLQIGQRRIGKSGDFQGVHVDFRDYPEIYDRLVTLAGNGLKHPAWQLGAKDFLDSVVDGSSPMSQVYQLYSDGPDGLKAGFIHNTIAEFRRLAEQKIYDEEKAKGSDFANMIDKKKAETNALRMPVQPKQNGKEVTAIQ